VASLDLFVVGFGRPDLLVEQIRLLRKNLLDEHGICVLDNTPDDLTAVKMQEICTLLDVGYLRVESKKHEHVDGLKTAARIAADIEADYWGVLDHDVFPRSPVNLIEKIQAAGFYGIGQRHSPTGRQYLWPGFIFFSRHWLDGRIPDFDGIRGIDKRDDGDCGSMLYELFSDEDWALMHRGEHGYGYLRDPDDHGLQSFGYEILDGAWVHLTNSSGWKQIPDRDGREALIRDMLAGL
jgi:hypothetical protein